MLLNLPRALEWLEHCRLDAIIATSWVNVLYLTDYYLWLQPVFKEYMAHPGCGNDPNPLLGVLTSRGNSALILDQLCETNALGCWAQNRYVYGATTAKFNIFTQLTGFDAFEPTGHRFDTDLNALADALEAEHVASGRLGVDFDGLSPPRLTALKAALPRAELLDASNLFRLIRMVKSDEELRRLRRAAEISELAAAKAMALAQPGASMQHISQTYRTTVAASGADFEHFAYSRRGAGMATEPEYALPQRETMFVDFGCVYQHYYSDAGVTLVTGKLLEQERSAYQALVDCLDQAANQLRPGASSSSIQAMMQRHLDNAGLGGNFPHGHGLGIEIRDYPILAPDQGRRVRDDCVDVSSDLPLEAGMVLNLEAPIFRFNDAGLQLEQSYLVTATGGEPLTNRDLTKPFFAGG
jgi:Xaa-Pro dipeptidase